VTLGRPLTYPEPWLTLAKQAGGATQLAFRLGVSRRTLERWAYGRTRPREMARRAVNAYAEHRGVEGPYR
jgi:transcriptional regulator with XRE-family HTH domain